MGLDAALGELRALLGPAPIVRVLDREPAEAIPDRGTTVAEPVRGGGGRRARGLLRRGHVPIERAGGGGAEGVLEVLDGSGPAGGGVSVGGGEEGVGAVGKVEWGCRRWWRGRGGWWGRWGMEVFWW